MAVQIQFRRGTAAQWTTTNTILASGEIGVELDTGKFKIGNGTGTWVTLVYANALGGPLSSLEDVVATSPDDGSLLIYQTSINKWVASKNLNQQNLDAGEF